MLELRPAPLLLLSVLCHSYLQNAVGDAQAVICATGAASLVGLGSSTPGSVDEKVGTITTLSQATAAAAAAAAQSYLLRLSPSRPVLYKQHAAKNVGRQRSVLRHADMNNRCSSSVQSFLSPAAPQPSCLHNTIALIRAAQRTGVKASCCRPPWPYAGHKPGLDWC